MLADELANLDPNPDSDLLLDIFLAYCSEQGIEMYESQEEAVLELFAGSNVILNTPTGSGKSLVALAAHFAALAQNKRSVYTAPIKALVSEKFFALCQTLGTDNVGMITGDASVNPDAPVICCTAEILANWVLREGAATPVDTVISDEFHFYGDPQRGWAWQVPLLELSDTQFLLMSATLGDPDFFETKLQRLTKAPTTIVSSTQRPVPLAFEYRRTTLHQSITDLLEKDLAPIYLVHFTQREATEAAQNYLSLDPLSKDEKKQIKQAIANFKFDSPIGKDIRRYISGGVGVHHAGLLPKYRLLIEKLASQGLLKIICGTDTLGVGVNVPIRSVLFTQLCKFDGVSTRLLKNREFQQIAGRAGRKGFDDQGYVWAQDPPHNIENQQAQQKALNDPKKKKKLVKKKPPERGYTHWGEETFTKMSTGAPETLRASFDVTHQMVLSVLARPGDGCHELKTLLNQVHTTHKQRRRYQKKAIAIYRSLRDAELVTRLDAPNEQGALFEVAVDLQDEFALHQPLSLWALEAIELELDREASDYPLLLLSVIEATLETPRVITAAQLNVVKNELMADLKARGIEYEERMEKLAEATYPQPNKEWIYTSFDAFRAKNPWANSHTVTPKGIIRQMLEKAMDFNTYVLHLGLKRSEGVVLRYLSDAYKALVQNVPSDLRGDEIGDVIEWLKLLIRQTDSSLIDEWEKLTNPDETEETAEKVAAPKVLAFTENTRAFSVMVRNQMFAWLEAIAKQNYASVPVDNLRETMGPYWEIHEFIAIDADARSANYFDYKATDGIATQHIVDPENSGVWKIQATVDIEASNEQEKAVFEELTVVNLEASR